VNLDGVWVGNQVCWILRHETCDYPVSVNMTHTLVFSGTVFTSFLVTASKGDRSPTFRFPNYHRASATVTVD
jgi:hypothetical protein